MRSMDYPALLWATVLIALLGSFQFGTSKPSIISVSSSCTRYGNAEPILRTRAYLLTLTVSSHSLSTCAGFHLGILNTAEAWVAQDLNLDISSQGAIITSAVIVGAVVGSLFAGQSADALGPKKALLLNNAWLLIGCLLCSGTPAGYWGLLAGLLSELSEECLCTHGIYLRQQGKRLRTCEMSISREHCWLAVQHASGPIWYLG